MKIKLDENLPRSLQGPLARLGHDVDTVMEEGLQGRDDRAVWAAAQAAERFLITQDLDFADLRERIPGSHHGVLLVRLRDPGRLSLTRRVVDLFEAQEVSGWQGCLVVCTERKVRVRRR